jgi:hypothetical protein
MDTSTKQALTKIINNIPENEFVFIIKTHAIFRNEAYERVGNQWEKSTINMNDVLQDLPSFNKLMKDNEGI